MAAEREPPPLGETRPTDFEELEDGEDLFTSTVSTLESSPSSPEPASLPTEDLSTNSSGPKPAEVMLDDDREDLFAGKHSFLLIHMHKLFSSWTERSVLFGQGELKLK